MAADLAAVLETLSDIQSQLDSIRQAVAEHEAYRDDGPMSIGEAALFEHLLAKTALTASLFRFAHIRTVAQRAYEASLLDESPKATRDAKDKVLGAEILAHRARAQVPPAEQRLANALAREAEEQRQAKYDAGTQAAAEIEALAETMRRRRRGSQRALARMSELAEVVRTANGDLPHGPERIDAQGFQMRAGTPAEQIAVSYDQWFDPEGRECKPPATMGGGRMGLSNPLHGFRKKLAPGLRQSQEARQPIRPGCRKRCGCRASSPVRLISGKVPGHERSERPLL